MATSDTHYRIHRDGEPLSYRRRHTNLDDAKRTLLAMDDPQTLEIREHAHGKTIRYFRPGPELLPA
jgi:hypothetical protein